MSYDDWKTHNPDDDRCEFCGVAPWECRGGWQPDRCTGECQRSWRDPDRGVSLMKMPNTDARKVCDSVCPELEKAMERVRHWYEG